MKKRRIKLAIIDNSMDSSIYAPVEHWKIHLNFDCDSYEAKKGHFPSLKKGYTYLILTGSEASILDKEDWVYQEIELVQEAAEKELSILGSCYGHKLLALALTGDAHVRRCRRPEVGWISVEVTQENALFADKKTFFSFSSHFDEVVNLDDSFTVLASNPQCSIQAFELRGKRVFGLQPHPEIDIPSAQKYVRDLINLNLRTTPLFKETLQQSPKDSLLIQRIVKKFLEL
jgi:GMP synthase-like glutamine amidotransferase